MSRLAELHRAAGASDERADWLRLWQAIAGTRLVVPVEDPSASSIRPTVTAVAGVPAVVAFEDMDTFAAALKEPGACAEIDGADLSQMLAGTEHALAITVAGRTEPIFVAEDVLNEAMSVE